MLVRMLVAALVMAEISDPVEWLEARRIIEAVLFMNTDAVSEAQLAQWIPKSLSVREILESLSSDYASRGIQLSSRGAGWRFHTAPDLAPYLRAFRPPVRRLSRAALEILAIIAWHQPVTRAEIEHMRGVAVSKNTLDLLVSLGWVAPAGRRQLPGRPLNWKTTPQFLEHFGLESLDSLPGIEELKQAGFIEMQKGFLAMDACDLERTALGRTMQQEGLFRNALPETMSKASNAENAGHPAEKSKKP